MKKNLSKLLLIPVIALTIKTSQAELIFQFKSPEFNGVGYSSHVQTIENTSSVRRKAIDDARLQAAKDAAAAANNTNLVKFLNNFESRVYAQLSTQLINNLFGENPKNSGSLMLEGNKIDYTKTVDQISLTVTDKNGNITQILIPVGSFGLN